MKRTNVSVSNEPIGIVISSGWRPNEPAPTLSAYIYGEAPESDPSEEEPVLEPVAK